MWEVITDLVSEGTSLLLTTQYLEEADRLADSIVVVNQGRVIASGTADDLKAQVGGERLEVVVADAARLGRAREVLAPLAVGGAEVEVEQHTRRLTVPTGGGTAPLLEAVRALDTEAIEVQDIGIRRPTLDDAFLALTGHASSADHDDESPAELAVAGRETR
jgi:ABC-2 type transport system ATP-binding protein